MHIRNVRIYKEDKRFEEGEIWIENGLFADSAAAGEPEETLDGEGCYAIPGLIDIHFHGCMGYDFCDGTEEAIAGIAEYEASVGVTGINPATMTLPVEELEDILATGAAYGRKQKDRPDQGRADFLGVNMEGPFISEAKKGAQDARNILLCDVDVFRRFQKAAEGTVNYIGVAPEREGALEFVEAVKDEVHVSLAHTNADYDSAKAAYDRGACHAVHLYNAMPAFTHRAPGVVGAAFDHPQVKVELISDGVHIHPSVVRAVFQLFGAHRVILISDSLRATGMPDGRYPFGGQEIEVHGNRATMADDPNTLAGSVSDLMACMRSAVSFGIPLHDAVRAAAVNPAQVLGIFDRLGSLDVGKTANLAILDRDLNLKDVFFRGQLVDRGA